MQYSANKQLQFNEVIYCTFSLVVATFGSDNPNDRIFFLGGEGQLSNLTKEGHWDSLITCP